MISVSNNSVNIISRALAASQASMSTSMQRLSTGLRVNSAKDDAAGLAIATRMSSRLRGFEVAQRNSNDGLSLAQTADAALGQASDMLIRMRELAAQSSSAGLGDGDRTNLNEEYTALGTELTRLLGKTDFNGRKILGADAGAQSFVVGADATDTVAITTTNVAGNTDLVAAAGGAIATSAASATAIGDIDKALEAVNVERSKMGAAQSRFESIGSGISAQYEALTAARSRIMDADMAREMANMTKQQVMQQAGMAMLSQANSQTSSLLSLLR